MIKMNKKVISLMLSILMVVGMVPFGELVAYGGTEGELEINRVVHSQVIRRLTENNFTTVYEVGITGDFAEVYQSIEQIVIYKDEIPIATENIRAGINTITMDIKSENQFISEIGPDDELTFRVYYGENGEKSKTSSDPKKLGTILTMQKSDIESLIRLGTLQMEGSGDPTDNSILSLSVDSDVGEIDPDTMKEIYVNLQGEDSTNAISIGSVDRQADPGREKIPISLPIGLVEEEDNRIIIRNEARDIDATSRVVYEYIYVDPAPNFDPFIEGISIENGPVKSGTNIGEGSNRVIAEVSGENFIAFYVDDEGAFKMPQVYLVPQREEGEVDFQKNEDIRIRALERYDESAGQITKLKEDPLLEKYQVDIKDNTLYKEGKILNQFERRGDKFVAVLPESEFVGSRDMVMVTPDGRIYRKKDAFEYIERVEEESEAEIKLNSVKPEKVNYVGGETVEFIGENILDGSKITVDGKVVSEESISIETNEFTGENTVQFEAPEGIIGENLGINIGKKIIQVIPKKGEQLSLNSYNYVSTAGAIVVGGDDFEYVNPKERPKIETITPNRGTEDQVVFLEGQNLREGIKIQFQNSAGNRVKSLEIPENDESEDNSEAARYNNTSLKFTVPDLGAPGNYKIIAVNSDGQESLDDISFTYTLATSQYEPNIDLVSPNYAIKGSEGVITIEGSEFQADAQVTIGGKLGTETVVSGDGKTIKVRVPNYEEFTTSGDVEGLEVYVHNVSDASFAKYEGTFSYFEFSNNPSIVDEIVPNTGSTAGGDTITIYGFFYKGEPGEGEDEPEENSTEYWPEIYFGENKAEYVPNGDGEYIWNSKRMDVELPAYHREGPVDITVVNHSSSRGVTIVEDAFTYQRSSPTIAESIEIPLRGSEEKQYIRGTDFIKSPLTYSNTKSKDENIIDMDLEVIFSDEVYTERIRGQQTTIVMQEESRNIEVRYDPNVDPDEEDNIRISVTPGMEPAINAKTTKEKPLYFSMKTSTKDKIEEGMKISVDENELRVERRISTDAKVSRDGTLITLVTPPMRRTGPTTMTVRNSDGGEATTDVTVVDPDSKPIITDIDEKEARRGPDQEIIDEHYFVDSGLEGDRTFTIRGSDFRTGVEVYIGYGSGEANKAQVIEKGLNDDYIVVKSPPMPDGVELGEKLPIIVRNSDGGSASTAETSIGNPAYPAYYIYRESTSQPKITNIEPDRGSALGGQRVVISGEDFRPEEVEVRFGANKATVIKEESNYEKLVVMTPPSDIYGKVDVSIRNTESFGDTVEAEGYEYIAAPIILEVRPDIVYSNGGEEIEILGKGFEDKPTVEIGEMTIPDGDVEFVDQFRIKVKTPKVTIPNGVDQIKMDVTVTNPSGESDTKKDGITFARPFPTRPTGFKANERPGRMIDLEWDRSTAILDEEMQGRYSIEISDAEDGPFRQLAEVADNRYMVRDLEPDKEYFFRLYAVNKYGRSEGYATADAKTLADKDDDQSGDFEDETETESKVDISGGTVTINYSKKYSLEDYTHDLTASQYQNARQIKLNIPASVVENQKGNLTIVHSDFELRGTLATIKSSEFTRRDDELLTIELTRAFDSEQSEMTRKAPAGYAPVGQGLKMSYTIGDGRDNRNIEKLRGIQLTQFVTAPTDSGLGLYSYRRGEDNLTLEQSNSFKIGDNRYRVVTSTSRSGYYIPLGRQ